MIFDWIKYTMNIFGVGLVCLVIYVLIKLYFTARDARLAEKKRILEAEFVKSVEENKNRDLDSLVDHANKRNEGSGN